MRTPTPPPTFTLPERDARQAGALALYAKGILLESNTQGDTNANRQAACDAFRQLSCWIRTTAARWKRSSAP